MKLSEDSIRDIIFAVIVCFGMACCTAICYKGLDARGDECKTDTITVDIKN